MNLNNLRNSPIEVTYTNSKGNVQLETNSSDLEAYAVKPDTYSLKIGNSTYEHKFALGGVYAILATALNETSFVRNAVCIAIFQLILIF